MSNYCLAHIQTPLLLSILFFISPSQAKPSPHEIDLIQLVKQGKSTFTLTPFQPIKINQNQTANNWKVMLGRKDFKQVRFIYFNNNVQNSMLFTTFGKYEITIISQSMEGYKNIIRYSIVANVQ
ncbi:hypothetical protein PE36_18099 [Moritella sp. PE36]|nr:hypothetical protein PE36_18099 [Moritella sp. PE36]